MANTANTVIGSIAHAVRIALLWLQDATRIDRCDTGDMEKTYRPEFRERQGQWEWAIFSAGQDRPVVRWSRPYPAKASAKADAEGAVRRLQARDSHWPEAATDRQH
jgi:hypothetical protein